MPRFAPAWGLGAEAETGPEAVNLAAWGGESGRGPARGEGSRTSVGGPAEFQFFGKRTFEPMALNGSNRHIAAAQIQYPRDRKRS